MPLNNNNIYLRKKQPGCQKGHRPIKAGHLKVK